MSVVDKFRLDAEGNSKKIIFLEDWDPMRALRFNLVFIIEKRDREKKDSTDIPGKTDGFYYRGHYFYK